MVFIKQRRLKKVKLNDSNEILILINNMKYIYLVLLLIACNKEDEKTAQCYACTFTNSYGGDTFTKDYCTSQPDTIRYYNSIGQQYSTRCDKK